MNAPVLQRLQDLVHPLAPWAARLPTAVSVLLLLGVAWSLAQLTWRLFPPPAGEAPPPTPVAVQRVPQGGAEAEDWARRLPTVHLFGELPKAPAPAPVSAPIEAPETALRLTLRGVFLGSDRSDSYAIIADERGRDETYAPGAVLPGGATLEEIYPDRVILKRNGRLETLRLPREAAGAARSTRTAATRSSPRSSARASVPPGAGEILARYRERLLNDPQSVMDVVRAEPYRRGGRILGYRVFPGRDRRLLEQVGLQPGDVITEVNGLGLDNPLNGLEIMRDLQHASQVSVKILRNGVEQELTVNLP